MISKTPQKDFNKKVDVVVCYLMHDDKFLVLHRQDHKPQGNTWCVPGGKVDSDDVDATHALSREISEEIGITINPQDFTFFETYYVKYPEYDFVYHAYSYKLKELPVLNVASHEHKDHKWVTPEEALKLDLIPGEDVCIKDFFKI